ncbi:cell wall-binding repeat-containing protein [Microcella alkalica]|uniref:cell wall-binding repeat-containing protein n=1 Tax=Microcella alkalica TaxID=355930 RepID=UPI00145FBB37|nr:cell wall-binding repeat-containing protein [Microcella alkalica]
MSVYTDGDRTAGAGTDGEGRFSIQVAPGTHTIGVTGRNPATGLLALPEFSGGSRSLEGADALTVAPGQTIVDADLELDAGGHIQGWPYLVVQPEGTVRGPDPFFTVFTLIHEDAPGGPQTLPAQWASPIGEQPVSQPLEPGRYSLTVLSNWWTSGAPFDPESTNIELYGERRDLLVTNGARTPYELELQRTVPVVSRADGPDRFAASAAISERFYEPGVPVVYLATGEKFPDALAGSAAAGKSPAEGPLLLTAGSYLPSSVAQELDRLQPARVVVLGGPASVSDAVVDEVRQYKPSISRISGPDRYAVSAAISAATFEPGVQAVMIATGEKFADALGGGAAAGATDGPLLLVGSNFLPASVAAEIVRLQPQEIVVLGGPASISESVVQQLRALNSSVSRVGGADRYEASAALAAARFPGRPQVAYLSTGLNFPDALSGGAPAGALDHFGPILLTDPSGVSDAVVRELVRMRPLRIVILGGPASVSDAVRAQVEGLFSTDWF